MEISKIAELLVDALFVDQKGVEMVKKMLQNRKTRVIMMPSFKSY